MCRRPAQLPDAPVDRVAHRTRRAAVTLDGCHRIEVGKARGGPRHCGELSGGRREIGSDLHLSQRRGGGTRRDAGDCGGGGVAIFDYDGDQYPDLFLPGGGRFGPQPTLAGLPPLLARNLGDLQFQSVTIPAGVQSAPFYSHGVAAADFDNDGFVDVLVTGYRGISLFQNQGDGTFRDVAVAAGMGHPVWGTGAAWGDLNQDGSLDVFIAQYVDWSFQNHPYCTDLLTRKHRDVCSPQDLPPLPDVLYLSHGDGTFHDASVEYGLRTDGKGLGVVMADLDLDGDLDVYVANDTTVNFLYRNEGPGRLTEVGLISGSGFDENGSFDGSMGVDVGDFNLDGLPDIWVTNFEEEVFALYRNVGNLMFLHASQSTGIAAETGLYVGWGTMFFDFDRDADLDLFVSNGHPHRYAGHTPRRQLPLLLENLSGTRVRNSSRGAGAYFTSAHNGRGAAVGDLDRDGDLDLVISHVNEPAAVLINNSRSTHHWLALRLIGVRSPRQPIGTRVKIVAGGQERSYQLTGGGSYLSSNEPLIFAGLQSHQRIERIDIRWPSGVTQTLRDEAADRTLTVIEEP